MFDLTLSWVHLQYKIPGAIASTKLRIIVILAILYIIRPSKPYSHLSNTLPIQMLEMFDTGSAGGCHIHTGADYAEWPLPELIDKEHWLVPDGNFKGWAPGASNDIISRYQNRTPEWLSDIPSDGFYRWQAVASRQLPPVNVPNRELARPGGTLHEEALKKKCADLLEELVDYNPVDDPLKITNLDQDLLNPLRKVLKEGPVAINHVIIVTMESIRMELFPLIPGSDTHKMILKNYPRDQLDGINQKLEHLSPNTQKITGHFTSFTDDSERSKGDSDDSFGGINVNGALTGSSFSFKSFLGSQCGVWPLPVSMLEETYSQIYQPCLPHILKLFNNAKVDVHKNHEQSVTPVERKWKVLLFSVSAIYHRTIRQAGSIEQADRI